MAGRDSHLCCHITRRSSATCLSTCRKWRAADTARALLLGSPFHINKARALLTAHPPPHKCNQLHYTIGRLGPVGAG